MATGIVKQFDIKKGFGFIAPDDASGDVTVHITAVLKAGWTAFVDGTRVGYDVVTDSSGKRAAENLRIADPGVYS